MEAGNRSEPEDFFEGGFEAKVADKNAENCREPKN